jgi:hypothetical protein
MISRKLFPFAVLGALAAADARASLLIDDFGGPTQTITDTKGPGVGTNGATVGTPLAVVAPNSAILGGTTRTVTAESVNTSAGIGSNIQVLIDNFDNGILEIANNTSSTGIASLQYDFASMDFTLVGSAVAMQVLGVDTSTQVQMTVTDALLGTSTTGFVNFGGAGIFYRSFVNFAGSADFTQITSIRIDLTGTTAWDAAFDALSVESVPEPATLTLLGAGLMGIGTLRKKRNG